MSTKIRTVALLLLCTGVCSVTAAAAGDLKPLTPEAAEGQMDIDFFTGINPSPDGTHLALDLSDPKESFLYEYRNQTFTRTGYSMWSGAAIYRATLTDLRSGQVQPIPSSSGVNWSGSWSPDGSKFAFYSDRTGQATVWILDVSTGQQRQLSPLVARMFRNYERPIWSPDGRSILFKAVPQGMTLKDLELLNPDVAHLYDKKDVQGLPTVDVYTTGAASAGPIVDYAAFFDYRFLADLVLVDVKSGHTTRIAGRVRSHELAFSPDGSQIASLSVNGLVPHSGQAQYSLHVYSVDGRKARLLSADILPGDPSSFSWSPDSRHVAYPSRVAGEERWACYVVDTTSGKRTDVSANVPHGLVSLSWGGAPLWRADGSSLIVLELKTKRDDYKEEKAAPGRLWSLPANGRQPRMLAEIPGRSIIDIVRVPEGRTYWTPDGGNSLIAVTRDPVTEKQGFFQVNVTSGAASGITEFDASVAAPIFATQAERRQFAFVREDVGHPSDVWVMDLESRQVRQVTHVSPQIEAASVGHSRLVEWMSNDGARLRGSLLLPAGYTEGTRVPLVVWIYGGNRGSQHLNRYGFGWGPLFDMQVLASRGYAVLYPDAPLREGMQVHDLASEVLSGVTHLVDSGVVDPDRLGVMGQSFGGYNTIALLSQTNRFAAAVMSSAADSDLFYGYSSMSSVNGFDNGDYYENGQNSQGGTPWQFPLRYLENSPYFFLDRVRTPLMLERGTDDILGNDSPGVFGALRRLGRESVLLEYPHEGHMLQRFENVVDFWNRRIDWLDSHLRR